MPRPADAHYDPLETREPALREEQSFALLRDLLRQAVPRAPALAEQLAGIEPGTIDGPAALARVPPMRKSELMERQAARPPFGGLNATPAGELARILVSPGPIFDPEGVRPDYWRFARALFAAGFRAGDLIHNTFGYHLVPAGFMLESGARALGCPVVPAGTGQTEQQLQVIARLRPVGYVGTPSFLKILLERGREAGLDLSCLTKALVSGEAFPRSLAEQLERDHGLGAFQCYATADLGLIAYETTAREGLVVDEGVIVEIVRPGTGDPVPEGEVGEVVVSALNPDYPLLRFATGDLSALLPGQSPCGRTNRRLRGWMGSADQTTKVRGLFVHPGQIAQVVRRHPEVERARLVVERAGDLDQMTLLCEVAGEPEGLEGAIAESLRTITSLRGEVRRVAPGTLANDGKVIDDRRDLP
jgi:phenylacetate-CoA ligase